MEPVSTSELPPVQPTRLERLLAVLATAALAALCILVTVGVLSRLVGYPIIPDNVLLVREAMVVVILLPLAVITATRDHIAVTVFTDGAGRTMQRLLGVLGHIVGLVFAGALVAAGQNLLMRSWNSAEYYYGALEVPTWIGHALFLLAAVVFALRLLALLVRDVAALHRYTDD